MKYSNCIIGVEVIQNALSELRKYWKSEKEKEINKRVEKKMTRKVTGFFKKVYPCKTREEAIAEMKEDYHWGGDNVYDYIMQWGQQGIAKSERLLKMAIDSRDRSIIFTEPDMFILYKGIIENAAK